MQQMLTGFFYIELKYIRINMLRYAKNVNHATSFAGLLIRKDCACLVDQFVLITYILNLAKKQKGKPE